MEEKVSIERIEEQYYKGYKLKILYPLTIIDCKGSKLSAKVKKEGYIVAVNGGGFTKISRGKDHIGYKVVNSIIEEGNKGNKEFIGIDRKGKIHIGGFTKEEIEEKGIEYGASFKPILIKEGKKQDISNLSGVNKGKTARTVIGKDREENTVIVIIEGSKKGDYRGVTIEELQEICYTEGMIDCINMDGGRSTILIYKGKIMNEIEGSIERKINNGFGVKV